MSNVYKIANIPSKFNKDRQILNYTIEYRDMKRDAPGWCQCRDNLYIYAFVSPGDRRRCEQAYHQNMDWLERTIGKNLSIAQKELRHYRRKAYKKEWNLVSRGVKDELRRRGKIEDDWQHEYNIVEDRFRDVWESHKAFRLNPLQASS